MPVWVTIPNFLTLLRLALVPFVVAAVLAREHTRALGLFLVAGFTDLIDGAVARHDVECHLYVKDFLGHRLE